MGDLLAEERTPGIAIDSDDELDAYIRASCYCAQHPTSTCAMGMGARSVVDEQLRVIGVEGLRVADASVMPTVPGGNTNLPTIMIGEKAADLIRGRSLPPAGLDEHQAPLERAA
jgi:choline dehydrogenase